MSSDSASGSKYVLCGDHDLWADELRFFDVDTGRVMVWRDPDENLHAYSATCPHQDRDLETTGSRECMCGPHDDETTLTCTAHSWEFDLESGEGVNPSGVDGLREYDIGVDSGEIFVIVPEET